MKRFLLVVMLLASAASVYAAELKITGDAEVRGVMDSMENDGTTIYENSFFDADFNFNAALVVTENTTVFTKLTFDSQLGSLAGLRAVSGTDTVIDQNAMDTDGLSGQPHTYLGVERAYISTKFLPELTVDAGLMGGGMWGTAFGNSETNVTRIKATYAVSEDMKFMAIYEKNAESNAYPAFRAGAADTDDGDITTYYLAANLKFGAITVLPLAKYVTAENYTAAETTTDTTWTVDVAVMGDMGMVGFEAEAVYASTTPDGGDAAAKYGAYVDVFAKLDPAKVGLAAFYASASTDSAETYSAGSDLDFLLVYEDMYAGEIVGMTAVKLYADTKFMEKFSAGAAFAYGMSNDTDMADVTFWEIDANFNYLIDAATTWTLEGGYASEDDAAAAEPTTIYTVQQKISVKF